METHGEQPLHGPFLWLDARRLVLLAPGLWILIVLGVFSLVTFERGRMWTDQAFALTFLAGILSAVFLAVSLAAASTQMKQRRAAGLEFFGPEQLFWLVRYQSQARVLGVTGDQLCLIPYRPNSFPPGLWHAYRQTFPLAELTAVELVPATGFKAFVRGATILRLFLASGETLDCELFGSGARALRQWRAVLARGQESETEPAPALRPEGEAPPEHAIDPAELRRRIEDLLRLQAQGIELVRAGPDGAELHLRAAPRPPLRGAQLPQLRGRPPAAEQLLFIAGAAARAALLGQPGVQQPPRMLELRYESLLPAEDGGVDAQAVAQPGEGRQRSVRLVLAQRVHGETRILATASAQLYLAESTSS